MALIYVLLVSHFVADFMCQSDWMAVNKSKRWDALGLHVLVYSLVLWFVVVGYGGVHIYPRHTIGVVSLFVLVNGLAHFVQDALTSRLTSRLWFFRPAFGIWSQAPHAMPKHGRELVNPWVAEGGNRHYFFVAIGFDQLLHYVTLFLTADWWLR